MKQLRGGYTAEDPRLDRVPQYDERSREFPISAVVEGKTPRSRGWSVRHWLDQQQEGACVSFAWHHEALALPKRARFASDDEAEAYARGRYHEMQQVDEWAGEDYEGTSCLAGAKVMQGIGYYDAYHWAFSLEDIILAIGYEGPVVMASNWYRGMYAPNAAGYLRPEGDIVGGHCYLLSSVSASYRRVTVWNSWGKDWGREGRAYIDFDDLDMLLHNQGEACLPIGRHAV